MRAFSNACLLESFQTCYGLLIVTSVLWKSLERVKSILQFHEGLRPQQGHSQGYKSSKCFSGPQRDHLAFTKGQVKIPLNSWAEARRWAVTSCSCNKSMPAARSLKKLTAIVCNTRTISSSTSCPRAIHSAQTHTSFFSIHLWPTLLLGRKNGLKSFLSQTRQSIPTSKMQKFYLYAGK